MNWFWIITSILFLAGVLLLAFGVLAPRRSRTGSNGGWDYKTVDRTKWTGTAVVITSIFLAVGYMLYNGHVPGSRRTGSAAPVKIVEVPIPPKDTAPKKDTAVEMVAASSPVPAASSERSIHVTKDKGEVTVQAESTPSLPRNLQPEVITEDCVKSLDRFSALTDKVFQGEKVPELAKWAIAVQACGEWVKNIPSGQYPRQQKAFDDARLIVAALGK